MPTACYRSISDWFLRSCTYLTTFLNPPEQYPLILQGGALHRYMSKPLITACIERKNIKYPGLLALLTNCLLNQFRRNSMYCMVNCELIKTDKFPKMLYISIRHMATWEVFGVVWKNTSSTTVSVRI